MASCAALGPTHGWGGDPAKDMGHSSGSLPTAVPVLVQNCLALASIYFTCVAIFKVYLQRLKGKAAWTAIIKASCITRKALIW